MIVKCILVIDKLYKILVVFTQTLLYVCTYLTIGVKIACFLILVSADCSFGHFICLAVSRFDVCVIAEEQIRTCKSVIFESPVRQLLLQNRYDL